VEKSDSEQL